MPDDGRDTTTNDAGNGSHRPAGMSQAVDSRNQDFVDLRARAMRTEARVEQGGIATTLKAP